jgi:SAM-dependent methyltransferase
VVIWLELFMVLYALIAVVVACSLLWAALYGIPYVPSGVSSVEKIFRRLKLPPRTRMVDLGSGDGRIVLLAASGFGWKATGVEINPFLNLYATFRKIISRTTLATFKTANLLSEPLNDYRIIFIYGFPAMMKKLQPKIVRECSPGTWIISRSFTLPGFKPVFSMQDIHAYRVTSN